jgi:hypothetical protein
LQVGHAARLEFKSGDAQSRAHARDVHNARLDSAFDYDSVHGRGYIEHVATALGGNMHALLKHWHTLQFATGAAAAGWWGAVPDEHFAVHDGGRREDIVDY